MIDTSNLGTWALAAAVIVLMIAFFGIIGVVWWSRLRRVAKYIEDGPERRRTQAEAESKAGKSDPLWLRAIRVLVILFALALVAYGLWQKV